jgi:hypothetical protein
MISSTEPTGEKPSISFLNCMQLKLNSNPSDQHYENVLNQSSPDRYSIFNVPESRYHGYSVITSAFDTPTRPNRQQVRNPQFTVVNTPESRYNDFPFFETGSSFQANPNLFTLFVDNKADYHSGHFYSPIKN